MMRALFTEYVGLTWHDSYALKLQRDNPDILSVSVESPGMTSVIEPSASRLRVLLDENRVIKTVMHG